MSTIRIRKEQNYFAASNVPFNDARLSWEARGILGYLLSKPDDWTVRFTDLVNKGPAGEHKVRRILKEMEVHGYLERTRIQNEGGKFEWVSTIYEIPPTISRLSTDGLPICGLSIDGSPIYGKSRDIVSTETPSTETPSTKRKRTKREEHTPDFSTISVKDALALPELQLFREVTGRTPGSPQYEIIYKLFRHHGFTAEYLKPFWVEWAGNRGYNPKNLAWLTEWAVDGKIPGKGGPQSTEEKLEGYSYAGS